MWGKTRLKMIRKANPLSLMIAAVPIPERAPSNAMKNRLKGSSTINRGTPKRERPNAKIARYLLMGCFQDLTFCLPTFELRSQTTPAGQA
jgi:hypothetical protein